MNSQNSAAETQQAMETFFNEPVLIVGGRQLSGWDSIRVTRGIHRMPSDFTFSMTERYPGEADFIVQPGEPCEVRLGADVVLTGYVDRYIPAFDANTHTVTLMGRGKCCDLVDCSALWKNFQIVHAHVLDIAKKLAEPYGIKASNLSGDKGPLIKQYNINPGESVYNVIESVCRFAALMLYEGTDGNLILTRAGLTGLDSYALNEKSGSPRRAASGFSQGVNVQNASIEYSMDQRYSEYDCALQSAAVLGDVGRGGFLESRAFDLGVKRTRRKRMFVESGAPGQEVTDRRVWWERQHRFGQSFQLHITTDSWRDKKGQLYEPNTLVDISLPALKCNKANWGITDWLISEVTYKLDQAGGTTCELLIMPQEVALPEPLVLQPQFTDVPPNAGLNTK